MTQDPQPAEPLHAEAPAHSFLRTHSIAGRRSSRNVQALIDSMKQNGWSGPPVAVVLYGGEKYTLDGHHRTFAARHVGLAVRFRVVGVCDLAAFGYQSVEQVVQAHAEAGPNRIRLR